MLGSDPIKQISARWGSLLAPIIGSLGLLLVAYSAGAETMAGWVGTLSEPRDQLVITGTEPEILNEILTLVKSNPTSCSIPMPQCKDGLCGAQLTDCLPENYQKALGKSFKLLGPNCFGTAMAVTGVIPAFRGVDDKEFQAYIDLSCVKTTKPVFGDLGVFEYVGFGFSHALVYLTDNLSLEKSGVDYRGPTPIATRALKSIISRMVTPECGKQAPDPSMCVPPHHYVHCEKIDFGSDPLIKKHNLDVKTIELLMGELLEKEEVTHTEKALFQKILTLFNKVENDYSLNVDKIPAAAKYRNYFRSRLLSLSEQIQFFNNSGRF